MCTSRRHPGVLAVGIALLVVALTDLSPDPHDSLGALFSFTARVTALVTAIGLVPTLARRLPRHRALIRGVHLGLIALLVVDLVSAYRTYVDGVVTRPGHDVALLAIAALVLVGPLLTFLVARAPAVPVADTASPAALRRVARALTGLALTALAGGALLAIGRGAELPRGDTAFALALVIAAPACLFAILLLAGLQPLSRAGGWALGAAALFVGALTVEVMQGIGAYRGWTAGLSETYGAWLHDAGMIGPLLGAGAILALGQHCAGEQRRRRPDAHPGDDVVSFAAFVIAAGSFGLQIAGGLDTLSGGTESPALAAAVVIVPWLAPLLAVPMFRRTARLLESEPAPPAATATPSRSPR